MKRIASKGLLLLSACMLATALAATSAAAFSAPEVGRCVKVAAQAGKFSSSSCTKEKAGGSYEWEPGAIKTKFVTTGGLGTLATVNGLTVVCRTEESGGEYSSPKAVAGVTVKFTGCESAALKCSTTGAGEGEIVTNLLEGRIGFESAPKHKIAFDLYPTAADGGLYVSFHCGVALHLTVAGSVLVPVSPVDKMIGPGLATTHLTLKYSAKKGHQKPEHFEGEPNDVLITELNGEKPEQSGITITSTQTSEEALEANAYA